MQNESTFYFLPGGSHVPLVREIMQSYPIGFIRLLALVLVGQQLVGCIAPGAGGQRARAERAHVLRGTRATYCRAPRRGDDRVDVDRLIAELVDIHANTYSFCIHGWATDWDDL